MPEARRVVSSWGLFTSLKAKLIFGILVTDKRVGKLNNNLINNAKANRRTANARPMRIRVAIVGLIYPLSVIVSLCPPPNSEIVFQ